MPAGLFYTTAGALKKAAAIRTLLNTGAVMLYNSDFNPTPATTLAEFMDHEVVADGYTTGGITVTAWSDGGFDPGGGASSFTQPNWSYGPASDPPVTALVGGCFITDTDGDLYAYFEFPGEVPFEAIGQHIAPLLNLIDGRN